MVNDATIQQFLTEGRAYIARKDSVQASEKLYKAAEETVKALAQRVNLSEWSEATQKGRWTTALLFNAVKALSERLNAPEVRHGWDAAWFLHVEGFHEARLDIGQVQFRLPVVEQLLKIADSADSPA